MVMGTRSTKEWEMTTTPHAPHPNEGAYKELIDEYRTWLRSWSAAETTVRARCIIAMTRLREWSLNGFTVGNAEAYLASPDFSDWTRVTYYTHLVDFCGWLVATGRLAVNPMDSVRKPKSVKSQPRPLSEADLKRVLEAATPPMSDWILFALLAGLRAHEIAKLRGEDISPDGIYVLGKGSVPATLPCHPDLWEVALRYPRRGYLFPGTFDGHISGQRISLSVGRFFRSLGLEGSVHRCRHSFGTRLLRSGVHIRRVQKLMRHASLETTATYTAVDEDELRDAILQMPATPTG